MEDRAYLCLLTVSEVKGQGGLLPPLRACGAAENHSGCGQSRVDQGCSAFDSQKTERERQDRMGHGKIYLQR